MYSLTLIRFGKNLELLTLENTECNGLYPFDNLIAELFRVHETAKTIRFNPKGFVSDKDKIVKMKTFDRLTIQINNETDDKCWILYINKAS